jgi:dynein light chain 4
MDAERAEPMDREAFLKMASYPLVRQSDMSEETRSEAIDICSSGAAPRAPGLRLAHAHALMRRARFPAAVEKFADNLEKAAQAVKDQMDKKFGAPWNVVIGEYFAFEITYEVKNLLYLFIGGTKGVLLWKSA